MTLLRPPCWACLHHVEHQTEEFIGECRCECHKCPGSGRNPDRWPSFDDHGKRPCPDCGQRVMVCARYYDHSRNPGAAMLADHEVTGG